MNFAERLRAVQIFRAVRDVPYGIDLLDRTRDRSCATKGDMLEAQLRADFKLEARHICCFFEWNTTPLPPALIALAPGPTSYHEYRQFLIRDTGNWVSVDPTFDKALAKAGFPTAEWDGAGSTVLPIRPYVTFSPEESAKIIASRALTSPQEYRDHYREHAAFYDGLNGWLEQQRNKPETLHA